MNLARSIHLLGLCTLFSSAAATTTPTFHPDTGILSLPGVRVGTDFYDATLRLVDAARLEFIVEQVTAATTPGLASAPRYSQADGRLELPLVQVDARLARASLNIVPDTTPLRFQLSSADWLTEATPGKPGALPPLHALGLTPDSPLLQRMPAAPELDPDSARYIAALRQAGGINLLLKQWTFPVYLAGPETLRHDLTVHCGTEWGLGVSTLKNVPLPEGFEPSSDLEGGAAPVGCGEASGQDNPAVVLDLVQRCQYDLWQARLENGRWVASWATASSMDGNGIFPSGLSGRGSGFSYLSGVIWPDELRSGRIEHMLSFSYKLTRAGGPVAPATDSDGVTASADALPEGAILQLDPELDLAAFTLTPYEQTIARAMQEYGLILLDSAGSGMGLYAVDPRSVQNGDLYAGLLPDLPYVPLNIPLEHLRVLKLPVQQADWRTRIRLENTDCARFE